MVRRRIPLHARISATPVPSLPRIRRSATSIALAAFALGGVIAKPTTASAGGYASARMGSDQGTPALGNAYAVYFNPAALGGTPEKTQLVLDATLAMREFSYTWRPAALTPDDPSRVDERLYRSANSGDARLFNVLASPFFGATSNLGTKNFRLGYAAYIPLGGQAKWGTVDAFNGSTIAPGAVDGPQRWHTISGQILAIYNTVAASYTFENIGLSVGVSVSGIYHLVKSVRARNSDGSDDLTSSAGIMKEGRSYLGATGFNLGAALGLYWENPDRKLRVGVSYTSQPGFGESRLKGDLQQQFGSDAARSEVNKADLLLEYPDFIRAGFAYRYSDEWEVRADADFARWSTFKYQCIVKPGEACDVANDGSEISGSEIIVNIPRKWKDTLTGRGTLAYFPNEDTQLTATLGFGTSAIPVRLVDPGAFDSFRVDMTLGAKYQATKHFGFGASANYLHYLPIKTEGRSEQARYAGASRSPSADGEYQAAIFFVNANVTYTF